MKNNSENIQAELKNLGVALQHRPTMPLHVPEGYFESSKQVMLETILAMDFVANLPKNMPQQIPDGYFEASKKEMLDTVLALDFVENLPKSMPYEIPANYFEHSKKEILDNVLALDFVATLPKNMPLELPVGYFEKSKNEILSKVITDRESSWTAHRSYGKNNWALAATMALLISLGLFFINTNSNTASSLESQLSSLSADEVNGYIDSKAYEFEALDILENPQVSSKKMEALENEILNVTKSMSHEELYVYVL